MKTNDNAHAFSLTGSLTLSGDKGSRSSAVVFDTGATYSCAPRELADEIATVLAMPKPLTVNVANGAAVQVTEHALLSVDIAGRNISDSFLVLPGLPANTVLLGLATMRKHRMKIDTGGEQVFVRFIDEKKEHTMLDGVKKILTYLGITKEPESEDDALQLVKAKIDEKIAAAKTSDAKKAPLIYGVSPKLLAVLGLPADATEDEVVAHAAFLSHPGDRVPTEQYEELNNAIVERDIADLVAKACAAGTDDFSAKIYPHEKEWLVTFAREHGLNSAREFVRKRPKVLAIMERLPSKKDKALVIDDTQRSINRQLGVSDEDFRKYNTN